MTTDATVWRPYTQMKRPRAPLEIVSTQGATLTLKNGQILTDAIASWWTACHGYNHPRIQEAIIQQTRELPHIMLGDCTHPAIQTLSPQLARCLPPALRYMHYTESGSVAVEVALKMALQYWKNQGHTKRQQFLCFEHAYHGDTLYAMSVCDPHQGMHRLFQGSLPQQACHPFPHTEAQLEQLDLWLAQHHETLAGMIIEPLVQGAGGMKMHTPDALQALCELCRKYDLLLIFDEVFTGFGRTGSLFAFEQTRIVPDILCLSKALTGGHVPLAVTVASQRVFEAFLSDDPLHCLMHGSTFTGHAIGCAAASASLSLFETQPRLLQVHSIAHALQSSLETLTETQGVVDVRIMGAIGVVQLAHTLSPAESDFFKAQFVKKGVFCRPFEDIVYTTPAFTITPLELAQITHAIIEIVRKWSKKFYLG